MTVNIMPNKHHIFFFAVIALTYIAGIAAPRILGFLPSIWAVIFTAALFFQTRQFPLPKLQEGIFITALLALAGLSSLWAPDSAFAVERTLKLAMLFIPGAFLLACARRISLPDLTHTTLAFTAIHLLIALFLWSEKTSGHQIIEGLTGQDVFSFKLNRSFVIFALFSVPLLLMVRLCDLPRLKKSLIALVIIITSAAALSVTESQTAQLCFLVGLFFVFAFPAGCRVSLKTLTLIMVLFTLFFPLSVQTIQNTVPEESLTSGILREASIIHRLEVWNYAADKAFDHPIRGNGIEALRFLKSDTWMKYQQADNALHAHNAVLQIWAEFGLIGALLMAGFVFYLMRRIWEEGETTNRRIYLSSLMVCSCCALTGYGLWQGWQIGLFITMTAITIIIANHQSKI